MDKLYDSETGAWDRVCLFYPSHNIGSIYCTLGFANDYCLGSSHSGFFVRPAICLSF